MNRWLHITVSSLFFHFSFQFNPNADSDESGSTKRKLIWWNEHQQQFLQSKVASTRPRQNQFWNVINFTFSFGFCFWCCGTTNRTTIINNIFVVVGCDLRKFWKSDDVQKHRRTQFFFIRKKKTKKINPVKLIQILRNRIYHRDILEATLENVKNINGIWPKNVELKDRHLIIEFKNTFSDPVWQLGLMASIYI